MILFNKIVPVMRVVDLPKTIDFYTHVLGFQLRWRSPNDGGGENCMIQAENVHMLVSTGSHLGNHPQFTGTLYFDMVGMEELYSRIIDRVQIVWPLESMDYGGQEFGIHDPDGYTLAFSEEVPEQAKEQHR